MTVFKYFQPLACALGLLLTSACVTPQHHARCEVSGEVLTRTGYDLGPPDTACGLVLDEWVNWEDGLSEQEAIAIGLWNNPAYQELLADLQITEADIIQASQLTNPQVFTVFPVGVKQWEFFLLAPLDVLWLRPLRVSAAELEAQRVAERLVQDGLNVVRDVRVAYIDWQLAEQRAEIADRGAKLRGEVAHVAEARLAAGDVAELDVSAVRVDAMVGAGEALRASRDADVARQRLRYVLGLQFHDLPLTPEPMPPADLPNLDVERLVGEAVASRPDLQAVQLAVGAAESRAEIARRDIWQLTGILPDINASGERGVEAGPGLRFNLPIFHQNQGAIARARADAERLRRQYNNRRDLAAWEVQQAYLQCLQAEQDQEIWRKQILPQASSAVQSSQVALQENTVSILLVLETTRQLLNAEQREREADAQLRRAIAELERSVGRRLSHVAAHDLGGEMLPLPAGDLVPPVDVEEATP